MGGSCPFGSEPGKLPTAPNIGVVRGPQKEASAPEVEPLFWRWEEARPQEHPALPQKKPATLCGFNAPSRNLQMRTFA